LLEVRVVVETAGLTRRFGSVVAVADLTVELPEGAVIGLVGPNGSGKSTLIRMLLGLIRPTSGSARILGSSIAEPQRYAGLVGALIENPAYLPGLSARANLLSVARLRGLDVDRVDEVLDVVGLTGRDREPMKGFSLGMKQRLGIACALLPDPKLLILDEPTNGLDPAGIVEIRDLLQELGRAGRTVIVSSHLLSEIEGICGYLVIIRFGVLMYAGPMADLLTRAQARIQVAPERDADAAGLERALMHAGWDVRVDDTGGLQVLAAKESAAAVNRTATAAGYTLAGLTVTHDSLESIFLQMTGREVDLSASGAAAFSPDHPERGI
jgi:ABC-2 type transport system ATP-binding protein